MAMWGITEDRRRAEVEAAAAIGPAEELAEAMAAPESLGDDRLEFQIMTQAGHLSAAMCRLWLLVAEYDRREAYGRWECRSMAHWLEWKCGLAAATAREHVRVARAIAALPVIREAFSRAELSYSKVRALTRVATVETEQRHRDRCRQPAAGAAAAGRPVALTPLLLAGLLRPTREPGPLAAWLPPHRIAVTMHLDAEAARQLHNRLHAVLGGTEAQSLMERLENLASRSDIDALGAQLRGEIDSLGTQLRAEVGSLRHELMGAFHKDLMAAVTSQTRSIIHANLGLVFASVSLAFAAARFAG